MAQTTGRELLAKITSHVGLTPELIKELVSIDMLCNMEYASRRGDTLIFHNLITVKPKVGGSVKPDANGGMEIVTVSGDNVTLDLEKNWNELHKLDGVRIDWLEQASFEEALSLTAKAKVKIDTDYLLAEAETAMGELVKGAKESKLKDGELVNHSVPVKKVLNEMIKANGNLSPLNYHVAMSRTYSQGFGIQASGFQDFITGAIADPNIRPVFDCGSVTIVPDNYLLDSTGKQVDFVVYIKHYLVYGRQEELNRDFFEMSNEYKGFIGYPLRVKWDVALKNFTPEETKEIALKATAKIDKIEANVLASLTAPKGTTPVGG